MATSDIYHQIRAIESQSKDRPQTPAEREQLEDLRRQSRELFDDAYQKTSGGDRAASGNATSEGGAADGATAPPPQLDAPEKPT